MVSPTISCITFDTSCFARSQFNAVTQLRHVHSAARCHRISVHRRQEKTQIPGKLCLPVYADSNCGPPAGGDGNASAQPDADAPKSHSGNVSPSTPAATAATSVQKNLELCARIREAQQTSRTTPRTRTHSKDNRKTVEELRANPCGDNLYGVCRLHVVISALCLATQDAFSHSGRTILFVYVCARAACDDICRTCTCCFCVRRSVEVRTAIV